MNIRMICLACALAFSAQANAQVPPEADEPQPWSEDAAWQDTMQADDDAIEGFGNEGYGDDRYGDEGFVHDDAPVEPVESVESVDTTAEAPSLKRELKRSLLGAVMPKVQRRLREAIGDER
jgi:hypothetical protein